MARVCRPDAPCGSARCARWPPTSAPRRGSVAASGRLSVEGRPLADCVDDLCAGPACRASCPGLWRRPRARRGGHGRRPPLRPLPRRRIDVAAAREQGLKRATRGGLESYVTVGAAGHRSIKVALAPRARKGAAGHESDFAAANRFLIEPYEWLGGDSNPDRRRPLRPMMPPPGRARGPGPSASSPDCNPQDVALPSGRGRIDRPNHNHDSVLQLPVQDEPACDGAP